MLKVSSSKILKQRVFQSFISIKCFDITSESLIIFIFLIRLINQLTIYNYENIISDPAINYFIKVQNISNITNNNQITISYLILVFSMFILIGGFFYSILSFKKQNQNNSNKINFIRFQTLFILTFRVFIGKMLSQIAIIMYNLKNYLLFAFIMVINIFLMIQVFLIQQFTVQISLIKSNKSYLSKCYHSFNGISQYLLLLTVVIIPFIPKNEFYTITVINIILALSFFLKLSKIFYLLYYLATLIFRKKYINKLVQSLQIFSCISCFVFYILFIPAYFIQLLKQNFFLTMCAIIIFLFKSFTNFLQYFQQQSLMFIESIPKLKQQLLGRDGQFFLSQAHYLIYYINHLMKQYRGQKEQILLSSILCEHFRLCQDLQCFCWEKRSHNKNKLMMDIQFRSFFLLSFVENIYRQFCEEFDIFALYLVFKLQVVGIFPQIQSNLLKYQFTNPSLKIYQEYIIYQINILLKKFLQDKNANCQNVKLQKVLLQEIKQKQILQDLRQLLNVNVKRYKLLSQAICNLNLVEQNCLITAELTKKVQLSYLQIKNRNQYNLYTQSMYYFYFTRISQTNTEASFIYNNIYTKTIYLKSLKGLSSSNIQKFMYEDRCCVFQSNLQPQNIGIISNLSENCYQIFGIRKQDLIFKSIKKIIPKFMNQQHDQLLQIWIKTGSFRNLNKKKITYVTNSKNICFKCMIYLQISTSFDRIKIYILVYKIQGQNYLLLDNKLNIQAYGQKIKDHIFSIKTLQQSLKNYCYNFSAIPDDYLYLQLQKKNYLQLYISQNKQSLQKIKNQNLDVTFVQKIQQFAEKALTKNRQIKVFKCKIQFIHMKLSNLSYFVIKFIDINQILMLQSQLDQIQTQSKRYNYTNKSIEKQINQKQKNKKSNKMLDYMKDQQQLTNTIDKKIEIKQDDPLQTGQRFDIQHSISETQMGEADQIPPQQLQSTSSIMTQEASYSFKKLINHIKETFLYEKKYNYKQLTNISIVLSLLVLIVLGCLIFQYLFYQSKLQSFQKIMIANQQVSDTLQYLQLMFSQALLIGQNCLAVYNQNQCQKSINQLKSNSQNFYSKISQQFQKSIILKATNDFPFYMYFKQQMEVNMGKVTNTITIQNFIQIFYYSIKKIVKAFQDQNFTQQTKENFFILNDNWKQIIKINKQIILLYQEKGLSQMNVIRIILYSVSGVIFLINIAIIIAANYFISNSLKRKQIMIRAYQLVPVSYIESMRKYFQIIIKLLNKKKFININDQICFPQIDDNPYYRPKYQFFYNISSIKRILFFFLFFLMLLLSNLISLYQIQKVLQPLQNIFIEQTNLIISQKKVFESYYQLKQLYILETNQTIRKNNLLQLTKIYEQSQIQFNKRALILLKAFEGSSNNYAKDFKKLLTEDICQLSKYLISEGQYQICKNTFFTYPEHGVFATMIYIHRATQIAEINLKNMNTSQASQIFIKPYYQDVDIYSSYVMKVFYIMSTRISNQINNFLNSAYDTCLLTIIFEILILGISVGVWIVFYYLKRKQFMNLYGNAMVFPSRIIKKTKKVLKDIEQCLVLKQF